MTAKEVRFHDGRRFHIQRLKSALVVSCAGAHDHVEPPGARLMSPATKELITIAAPGWFDHARNSAISHAPSRARDE